MIYMGYLIVLMSLPLFGRWFWDGIGIWLGIAVGTFFAIAIAYFLPPNALVTPPPGDLHPNLWAQQAAGNGFLLVLLLFVLPAVAIMTGGGLAGLWMFIEFLVREFKARRPKESD